MATFKEYNATGGASEAFAIPSFTSDEIKVRVDGVLKTAATHYNITSYTVNGGTVTWTAGNVPNGVTVRIYRETDIINNANTDIEPYATYYAGSSIKADDLNGNQRQVLRALAEGRELKQTWQLGSSEVKTANIANDAVDSQHYAAGSIDLEHMSANSVDSDQYVDGSIDLIHLSANSVDSSKIVDGTIVNADISGSAAIDGSKIAASTTSVAGTISAADKTKLDGIEASATADQTASEIRALVESASDSNVFTDADHSKLNGVAASANNYSISSDLLDEDDFSSDSATKPPSQQSTKAYIAATSQPLDSDLTTLAGMQSGTASILASGTALTSTTDELNLLDGKSVVTSVSGSSTDNQLPTAKAVNDQIVSLLNDAGGFVPIANEVSFPNTNPDPSDGAGTIVSIADAGGVVVNGSGVSTTGRTLNGTTVTINGIDSSLYNTTIAAGKGMLVQTTSTLNTYTYHRLVIDEAGVDQAQTAVNSFNERYRVGSSNPSSSLDDGDLFFNTTSNKMLVYNATGSSWDEVQSVGNFFINTISSYSGTGGNSATFNGSAYRFVLSNPGANAEQHLVSINGVVQKPNSGTSQPSEGFAIDGSSIIFSSAPASNADFFIITIGASVNIGTPSAGTVATLQLANGAVTTDKLADANVTQAKLADQAVNEAKLQVSNSPTNGYFLSAQSGNTGGLTWAQVSTDLVADTSPQLGGDLDTNSHHILIDDDHQIRFGASNDLVIQHNTNENYIQSNSGHIYIRCNVDDDEGDNIYLQPKSGENSAVFVHDGEVKLFYNNALKLETTSTGVQITGNIDIDGNIDGADGSKLKLGTGDDFQIYHDGTNSIIDNTTGELQVTTDGIMRFNATEYKFNNAANNEIVARFEQDGACELYYNHSKKLETNAEGVKISGYLEMEDNQRIQMGTGDDLHIYHDGSHSRIQDAGTGKLILQGSEINLNNAASTEYCLRTIEDGAVELYHNGNKKFETTASGVDVAGNCTITGNFRGNDNVKLNLGNGDDLQIYHNGSNSIINNDTGDLYIQTDGNLKLERKDGGEDYIHCIADGAVELHYNGSKTFETTSYGIKTDNLPRQNVFNTSSSSQSVSNSEVAINASQISLTLKEANPKLVYSYHMNGELDGNRGQTFYRLFYSTNSNYSGETAATSYAFQGGGGSDGNNGGFNDSGTFVFNLTASAGTTIYLRLRYKQTDSAATEFNQSGLDGQPSGSSNVSFVRVEEFAQ